MQYLLFVLLLVLFFISYYFSGKDFFSPTTMMIISFIVGTAFSLFIFNDSHYSISIETVGIIISFLIIGVIIGIISHNLSTKMIINRNVSTQNISPLSSHFSFFAIFFVFLTSYFQLKHAQSVGGYATSFFNLMTQFRSNGAYSLDISNQVPFWLSQMNNFVYALFVIHAFNLIKFYSLLSAKKKILQIFVMILCIVCSLLSGGRFSAITNIILCISMYHLLRIQRLGKYKTYNFSFLIRFFLIIVLTLVLFYFIKEAVGRVSDKNLIDYIANYLGNGIVNFDMFLDNPPVPSNIWGKETLYSLYNGLRKLGLVDIDFYYIHLEFRQINGYSTGNVYTILRRYIYDFGIGGACLLFSLLCSLTSMIYERIKKKQSDIAIIIFSMMYYCFVLCMFDDYFYTKIISFGFLIQTIMVWFLYQFFICKGIRIKI